MKLKLFICVSVFVCSVKCGRVLVVFPFLGKSHFYPFEEVCLALAKRGHDVTVISQFPQTTRQEHYTDIDVRGIGRPALKGVNISEFVETGGLTMKRAIDEVNEYLVSFEKVFDNVQVKNIITSNTNFDVVLTEILVTDMFVGFAHRCKANLIGLSSTVVPLLATDRFGIPDNPSYIGLFYHIDAQSKQMSFLVRMLNSLGYVVLRSLYPLFIASNDERVNKMHLGNDVPTVGEMVMNSSLLLVNSHFSLTGARPLTPQVIEIGGAHIKPANPLPQDIEKFINESEHGVVYFSLGSIANVSSMSDDMRKAFINSFAKIKQRVLWKWEVDEMPDKPDNVKIVKWMPQNDVLAHPKVKVFIGHGGLLGTMEAVYHAVPILGIPLFADQFQNIENLVHAGMAEQLDFRYITEEAVTKALTAVLEDPKYKMNAERMSKLFRDRPLSALDTAVYWVEYVMRHKGAHHLRTAAVNLPWYQYLLLDVIGAFVLLFVLVVYILVFVVKFVFRKLCGKKKEKVQ